MQLLQLLIYLINNFFYILKIKTYNKKKNCCSYKKRQYPNLILTVFQNLPQLEHFGRSDFL